MSTEAWQQAWVEVLPDFSNFGRKADSEITDSLGRAGSSGAGRFNQSFSAGVFKGSFLADIALRAVDGVAAAVSAGIDYAFDAVDLGSGLGEQVNAVRVQFGDLSDEILDLSKLAPKNLNLTRVAFDQLAVRFSSFAKTVAGDGGRADKIVAQLTQRGADFASVYDIEVGDALSLFQSGLAGETEPLRRFGIDLSAAAVESYAYAHGIAAAGEELTEAQKIQARYGALLEQTAAVQGDLANTAGSYANQQRAYAVALEEAQTKFGEAFLPTATDALKFANEDLLPILSDALDDAGPVLAQSLRDALPGIKDLLTEAGEALPAAIDLGGQIAGLLSDSTIKDLKTLQFGQMLANGEAEFQGLDWAKLFADGVVDGFQGESGERFADAIDLLFNSQARWEEEGAEQAAKLADAYSEGFATADGWDRALTPIEKLGIGIDEQHQEAIDKLSAFHAALEAGNAQAAVEAFGIKVGIEGHIKDLGVESGPLGQAFIDGLANALRLGQVKVGLAARDVAQAAVNSVRKTLDSHSPSRVMEAEGDNAIDGLIKGWTGKPIPTLTIPSVRVPDSPAALADVAALAEPGSAYGSAASGLAGRELTLVVDGRPMRAYIAEGAQAQIASYDQQAEATVRMGRAN